MADFSRIGRNSRRKGHAFERKVANTLTKVTGFKFARTPYSGGGHVPGDVMRLDGPFMMEIECKNRRELTIGKVFKNPHILGGYLKHNRILVFNDDGQAYAVLPRVCLKYTDGNEMRVWGIFNFDGVSQVIMPLEDCHMLHPGLFEEGGMR